MMLSFGSLRNNEELNMLTWKVKNFDMNKQAIIDYDVLKHRLDIIKKFKKLSADKAEFSERLKIEMKYYYWCRSEYELVIERDDTRVFLRPWSGCREPELARIEIQDTSDFDWWEFACHHTDRQINGKSAKIDIWSQLNWRWEEFVDYCWYTHLPYERKHEKFSR